MEDFLCVITETSGGVLVVASRRRAEAFLCRRGDHEGTKVNNHNESISQLKNTTLPKV